MAAKTDSRPARLRPGPLQPRRSWTLFAALLSLGCGALAQSGPPSPPPSPGPLIAPRTEGASAPSSPASPASPPPSPSLPPDPSTASSSADAGASDLSSAAATASSGLVTSIISGPPSSSSSSSPTSSAAAPTLSPGSDPGPLPSPFDDPDASVFDMANGAGSGGGQCSKFILNLLADPTFKSCYPLSMLFQTSIGFFDAQKSLPRLVAVLDAADDLADPANCKAELDMHQARVLQAWRGLSAYRTVYAASCLRNPSSSQYCLADAAAADASSPGDSYLYFLPFGLALPAAAKPTCSRCTADTMRVFHAASADRDDLVAARYEQSARQVDAACGPDFANATLPAVSASPAAALVPPSPRRLLVSTALSAVFVVMASSLAL